MKIVPGNLRLYRFNNVMPIICLMYTANDTIAKTSLLSMAMSHIEQAKKFKGFPIADQTPEIESKLTIYFSLMFPSEKDLQEFVNSIVPRK